MTARFSTAQDGPKATEEQLAAQKQIATVIADAGLLIEIKTKASREQSLALTKLEEALMWAGKAIFQ